MSNLLMLFKQKYNHIFGGYSPCQWHVESIGLYVADYKLSSLLFSQIYNKLYPFQSVKMINAIYYHKSYGPTFGAGRDLHITIDFNGGCSNIGNTYKQDDYQNAQSTFFCLIKPQIVECEFLMLTFM
ncbi:unnamed protein product [Paramecium pentaurelia]|uniref:TLDc domain-containing protein n=1 Tax=Paramecium pentaurelia TaxID=43138 RepID=A0A8S1UZD5_9CILI|nr:unnamed protein product [Paramecium pentaurelia]